MPPKSKRGPSEEDDVFKVEGEEEKKPEALNLGDAAALKRALDDAVVQVVADAGCHVDHGLTDAKIGMGLLACAVAALAQFFPKAHPLNFYVVAACVAAYAALSGLMSLLAAAWEKDAIALTRAAPGGPPALAVSSRLPRFEELYTLRIALRGSPGATSAAGGSGEAAAALTRSVGAYFHADGHLSEEAVRRDTQQLLRRFVEAKTK